MGEITKKIAFHHNTVNVPGLVEVFVLKWCVELQELSGALWGFSESVVIRSGTFIATESLLGGHFILPNNRARPS